VKEQFCNQEHKFHSYVVIIHSFGVKPICVVHLFGSITGTRIYVLCVVELHSIVEILIGRREEKERKEQIIIFVLKQKM